MGTHPDCFSPESADLLDELAGRGPPHFQETAAALGRRPGVEASPFYGRVFAWAAGLVDAECRRLGVAPVQADWVESEALKDGDLEGGQLGGCRKPAEGAQTAP